MEKEYKIIILGDYRSGKTSLIQMSHDSTFNEVQQVLILNIQHLRARLGLISESVKLIVHQYDVGGGENFMRIVKNFMKRMHQAIIVYDVTNPEGLNSIQRWLDFINQSNSENLQVIIVANKIDKIEQRVITPTQGITFAQQWGLQYYETSAKDKYSVEFMFESALQSLIMHRAEIQQNPAEIVENQMLWQKLRKYQTSIKINIAFLIILLFFVLFTIMFTNVIDMIYSFQVEKNHIISTVIGIILTLFSFIFLIYTGLTLGRQ